MKNNPLVSVIMSTYNTEKKFLKSSIDSVLNQSYKNLELIIVVDGGDDDIYINKFYNDDRIKIIKHNKNLGLPFSLNEAIKAAKGEFIARMDSDDISRKNRIAKQVEYMNNNSHVDILSTWYKTIGTSSKLVREKNMKSKYAMSKLFFVNIIAHPSVMFRRKSIFNKNLFYNEKFKYSQDFELWNRNNNVIIEILPYIGIYYRVHNNQVSTSKKNEQEKFYRFTLTRNLEKLCINPCNIDFLLILNGRKKSKDYKKVYNFIIDALNNNLKLKMYDFYAFDLVLKKQYIIYSIKNKQLLNKYFFKNLIYVFKRRK